MAYMNPMGIALRCFYLFGIFLGGNSPRPRQGFACLVSGKDPHRPQVFVDGVTFLRKNVEMAIKKTMGIHGTHIYTHTYCIYIHIYISYMHIYIYK